MYFVKIKKKKKFEIKLLINGKKIYEDKNIEKEKPEIKEIILFKNFISLFYSLLIFKNKVPKFIKDELKGSENNNNQKKINIYSHRFNNEEHIIPFLKMEINEEEEKNSLNKIKENNEFNFLQLNNNDYKEFMDKIISNFLFLIIN